MHVSSADSRDRTAHRNGARTHAEQACEALDAFGFATIAVRAADGALLWETPLARDLLLAYYGTAAPQAPRPVLEWVRQHQKGAQAQAEPPRLSAELGARKLGFRLHRQLCEGEWLISMRETSEAAVIEALGLAFGLTPREAEVLYWVVKGKINRDIADILGTSPATAKKHLERILAKTGAETRTAAAAMAMARVRQLHPQLEL